MDHQYYDIRCATLSEFEAFVFDHKVENCWYHDFELKIEFDPIQNINLFSEMFEGSKSLIDKYDRLQIEQGCWAMSSTGFDGNLYDLIWYSTVPTDAKIRLISSMFHIYDGLFSIDPLGACSEMWWDGLAYDFNPMRVAKPESNPEHYEICEAMFSTLSKILKLDSIHCQFAALHGLNHVNHPKTSELVNAYIRKNPALSAKEKEYALLCARGKAL